MKVTQCPIAGLMVVMPAVFADNRGHFFEAYNEPVFSRNGINCTFVQDNQSRSTRGVIRGLHYQNNPFAQSKLVRVLQGAIIDVAVDIRRGSPTFGEHFAIELSEDNQAQLFIPAGFAHGFSVLTETAVVMYKCDALYNKESEGGILFSDPALGIKWGFELEDAVVSGKDNELPLFKDSVHNFQY